MHRVAALTTEMCFHIWLFYFIFNVNSCEDKLKCYHKCPDNNNNNIQDILRLSKEKVDQTSSKTLKRVDIGVEFINSQRTVQSGHFWFKSYH